MPDVVLNPSERILTLKNLNNTKAHFSIYNLSGKVVQTGSTASSVIDICNLHHGLYLVILYDTDNSVVLRRKFVITDF
ncbi:T9SS type A sorting domain-containing protein [Saccharicrinis sp. FJH2]|uniref:T9SS type A sorting domain-containing protein n=1 Tax=Saccharicrinis sp. FJH65 TaxID=3344659 RepID=UPI0035F2576D